jgi:hypothetical protein
MYAFLERAYPSAFIYEPRSWARFARDGAEVHLPFEDAIEARELQMRFRQARHPGTHPYLEMMGACKSNNVALCKELDATIGEGRWGVIYQQASAACGAWDCYEFLKSTNIERTIFLTLTEIHIVLEDYRRDDFASYYDEFRRRCQPFVVHNPSLLTISIMNGCKEIYDSLKATTPSLIDADVTLFRCQRAIELCRNDEILLDIIRVYLPNVSARHRALIIAALKNNGSKRVIDAIDCE